MDETQAAIVQAANEAGIDPAFALAVAQRESNFNPNASASKTIYGLFQMRGDLRRQYGAGDSSDPYTQAKGWAAFIGDQKAQMEKALGRPVSNEELYFAHHFGTDRAIQMISGMPANTNVADVFSPYERSINPHFDQAGTTGNLMASITGDIRQRMAAFGGQGGGSAGSADQLTYKSTPTPPPSQATDFASYGRPMLAESTPAETQNDLAMSEEPGAKTSEESAPSAPSAVASAEPVYGMSAPEAQHMMSNPGYMAERMAQMRGGRAGQEIDVSQFGVKPGANLKNPALSNAAPANPAIAAATQPEQQQPA